jgi:hypothetical protein
MTSPFLAALRHDGLKAPCVLDSAISGLVFFGLYFVPSFRPDDIVVMDNLGSHKVAGVREAIEAVAPLCTTCQLTHSSGPVIAASAVAQTN